MSSPTAAVGSGRGRVVRPQSRFLPYREEQDEERSRLLSKMDAFYSEAYCRLPDETRRVVLGSLYDAGVCIGLLDPVSNIVANALVDPASVTRRGPNPDLTADETKLREEMGKRSVDGLVAFRGSAPRIEKLYCAVIDGKMRSEAQQTRIYRKVEAALGKHLLQDGDPMYELHIICSANDSVCGPEYCSDNDNALSPAPCKFRYSHVNFLATRKGARSADRHPILFFAEFDNEEEEGEPLLCCPVDVPTPFAEHVRCVYCEADGLKIVHPASEKLHGGGSEFDVVICGKRFLNNDMLICQNELAVQRMWAVDEDFMYVTDFKY